MMQQNPVSLQAIQANIQEHTAMVYKQQRSNKPFRSTTYHRLIKCKNMPEVIAKTNHG